MVARGRTAATAGASASRSSSSTSTSSGQASASTSSSGTSSSGAGAARSSRSSSSVSVSSPSASKTVTTTKTTTPTETKKETTAEPQTPITVSADLAAAISQSQQAYPDAWNEATGTSNVQKQFEQVTGKTIPSLIIEAPEITEPEIPEISILPQIPEVVTEQVLANDIIRILNDIENGVILVPDWFRNNMKWVQNGQISQQEFRSAYNYLIDTKVIHPPEKNKTTSPNMINQKIEYAELKDNKLDVKMELTATTDFNSYWFNQNLFNIIQVTDSKTGLTISTPHSNIARFRDDARRQIILHSIYPIDAKKINVESFVWTNDSEPMAKPFNFSVGIDEPVKIKQSGFMAAGFAGGIAMLILGGFIADYKGNKK